MNVSYTLIDKKQRLNILESLKDKSDQDLFLQIAEEILEKDPVPLEVVFYDANILRTPVILLLGKLHKKLNLTITVYHQGLNTYFNHLGFKVKQKKLFHELSQPPTFTVIALGGSADSLNKILYLIPILNPSELTIFIVQHVMEDAENRLDQILQQKTDYRVIMPTHLEKIKSSTIYIAPPGKNMKVSNGFIYLTCDQKLNLARPSIGALFESVALEYGDRAILSLLCGFGGDGVPELKLVQEQGSTMIIEDSEDCEAKPLVQAAKETGNYNHLLYCEEIGSFLAAATLQNEPKETQFTPFLEAIKKRYGYDYLGFKKDTLQRRVKHLMSSLNCSNFYLFQQMVLENKEIFYRLFEELSINVTCFFRDAKQWKFLVEKIFPQLDSYSNLRVWSAGCSTGEEVVSLAILLEEAGLLSRTQIYGSDLNPIVLGQAKNFLYPKEEIEKSQRSFVESGGKGDLTPYFDQQDNIYQLKQSLQKKINFFHHSLINGSRFNEFHLVICRNVLIYFNADNQAQIFQLFANSLHRSGFLVLGKDESLQVGRGENFFNPVSLSQKVYEWKEEAL